LYHPFNKNHALSKKKVLGGVGGKGDVGWVVQGPAIGADRWKAVREGGEWTKGERALYLPDTLRGERGERKGGEEPIKGGRGSPRD